MHAPYPNVSLGRSLPLRHRLLALGGTATLCVILGWLGVRSIAMGARSAPGAQVAMASSFVAAPRVHGKSAAGETAAPIAVPAPSAAVASVAQAPPAAPLKERKSARARTGASATLARPMTPRAVRPPAPPLRAAAAAGGPDSGREAETQAAIDANARARDQLEATLR